MIDVLLNYFANNSFVSIFVLFVLSAYLIFVLWLFFYKYTELKKSIIDADDTLKLLVKKDLILDDINSGIVKCMSGASVNKDILDVCELSLIKEASSGLSWLSIVASTSPFIGLFGTVVGILEAFAQFSLLDKVRFSSIAPVISEALVATAAGIFVAIFAYTFHQILIRKIYVYETFIKSQSKILLYRK